MIKKSNGGHKKQKWIKIGDKSTRWVENFEYVSESTTSDLENGKKIG